MATWHFKSRETLCQQLNGSRYVILYHSNPIPKISLRLLFLYCIHSFETFSFRDSKISTSSQDINFGRKGARTKSFLVLINADRRKRVPTRQYLPTITEKRNMNLISMLLWREGWISGNVI